MVNNLNTNTTMNLTKNQKIGLVVVAVAAIGYYMWTKKSKKEEKASFADASGFKKNFIN